MSYTVRLEYCSMRFENDCESLSEVPELMGRMADRHRIIDLKISGPHTAKGRRETSNASARFTVIHR